MSRRSALAAALRAAAIASVLAALAAMPAFAHEGDATLELDPATVAPDGGVLVVGRGLEPSTTLRLTLESLDQQISLGEVDVDRAGSIEQVILIPADLPPGVYGMKLSEGDALVASNVLQVDSTAGPGQPVDRGPAAPIVLGASILAAITLLLGLRLVTRRRRRLPVVEPAPTR